MAIDVQTETLIERPRADVVAYATNPAHDPAWIGGVVEAALVTDPPLAAGSGVRRVAKFLGQRIEYVTEVVDFDAEAGLTMRATTPFPMNIRYEFEHADSGTLARIRIQGGGRGFFRLAEPLLARQVRDNVSGDLKRLKGILEATVDARA